MDTMTDRKIFVTRMQVEWNQLTENTQAGNAHNNIQNSAIAPGTPLLIHPDFGMTFNTEFMK